MRLYRPVWLYFANILQRRYGASMKIDDKSSLMTQAIAQAQLAAKAAEVPVGAVIYDSSSGTIIAAQHNLTETNQDSTAHAELLAIQQAQKVKGSKNLSDCDIWVTLEPCAMCAGALAHARIRRIYFGAADKKGGAVEHGPHIFDQATTHHKPEIYGGFQERKCAALLTAFFAAKRS